ncbi:MAG: transketolase C-terminal domain-containing protein [Planctomycetaceae bacterium]|jgi:transketolase
MQVYMTDCFVADLVQAATQDSKLVLLAAEAGRPGLAEFARLFPERYFAWQTAEPRLIQQAVGMALSGLKPVVCAPATAWATRCLEVIEEQISRRRARVLLLGTPPVDEGARPRHRHDLAFLRPLPHFALACPADRDEWRSLLRGALSRPAPTYLRLPRTFAEREDATPGDVRLGRVRTLSVGTDVTLVATGEALPRVVAAAQRLAAAGLSAGVASCPTVKPLDQDFFVSAFEATRLVVTVEDHGLLGGFGAAVAEWLADHPGQTARLLRLGIPELFTGDESEEAGATAEPQHPLDPALIAQQVLRQLRKRARVAA